MNDESGFACLRRSPLTTGPTDEQARALAGIAYCRQLADQRILICEGNVENSHHIIAEGL